MSQVTKPYIRKPGEGELRWMGETSTSFLGTGVLSGGAFALVEEQAVSGVSVPLHRHDDDTESFYVLDGEIAFYLNGEAGVRLGPGTFVHIPGGTIHGFRIESTSARYLILTTTRHADFYRAITGPTPLTKIDGGMVNKACREYGIEFVGPLPA
ncbi:hypothetical protein BH23GEM2_BH23GEM2_24340 [soil metagenome]